MSKQRSLTARGDAMLQKMQQHVLGRLERELTKWQDRQDSQAKQAIKSAHEKYCLDNILRKGASCSRSVAVATHIAKATHPDLKVKKTSNLNVQFADLPFREEVGSHLLSGDVSHADTTGNGAVNSAAYELYLVLDTRFDGKSFGTWLDEKDQDAIGAFNAGAGFEDEGIAEACLLLLDNKSPKPSADYRSKQMYWLVGENPSHDADYHLLAPLYATSLSHQVFKTIRADRFGEHAKAGRKARRENVAFEGGYSDYLNLAVQKLGGTKPQNISQLNSERGGQNYLLASLPPHWQTHNIYPPMRDAFRAFKRRPTVWKTVHELKRFLETDPAKNMHTRDLRDDFITMLVDELMLFTFDMHSLAPGWTADDKCELGPEEQYWLDPGRALQDSEFDQARRRSPWHEAISDRAAAWLNRQLNYKSALSVGDLEHDHWQRQIEAVLKNFRRQLDDLQDALRDDDESLQGESA